MTKKIALDCGHGLNTAGKRTPDGIREWELNDKVRDRVVAYLDPYDVDIIFPDGNEGKVDESLVSRYNFYMNENVDLIVSIHHNAFTSKWNDATGVEVFTDRNPIANDVELAKAIYKRLTEYTGLRGRGIKQEDFLIINQNKIPAVLVEGGFMDSRIDYPVITSAKGQDAYARAVAEGIIEYLNLKKKPSGSKPKPSNVEKYSGYVEVIYSGKDGLDIHSTPTFNGNVSAVAKKGDVFTVIGRVKVQGVYMYQIKSGMYITSAKEYVSYRTTLHGSAAKPKPKPKKTAKDIALEIYNGKCSDQRWNTWGTDPTRSKRLKLAGYDPEEVRKEVNKLF